MSIRYGIDLVLQPSFTAKVHQVRRIVCDQYASPAAERQMLRMPLAPYFACPDDRLPALAARVEGIAQETEDRKPFLLSRSGIAAEAATNGVVMEFEASEPLLGLQRKALDAARSEDAALPLAPFRPRIALLEYGSLPEAMLHDAAQFAEGAASGLDMMEMALPWRLALTRYRSEAAGEDWSDGRWAADLAWEPLYSHRLYAEVSSVFEILDLVKQRQATKRGERKGIIGRFFGAG